MSRSQSRGQGAAAPLDQPGCAAAGTDLAQPSAPSRATAAIPIGVGIDTSRYGHHACFLRGDLQPAAGDLTFVESAEGYRQLRERLEGIACRCRGPVHFHCRLDLAGRYADNLLAFLHELGTRRPGATPLAQATFTISCGDPQRNKNYRAAIYGAKKSDPVEAQACARYALTENPKPTMPLSAPQRLLGQIASRLESQARQNTRLINQLHNLLSRTFPELALLVKDVGTGWVLSLLGRYPTAARLAAARPSSLEKIPYLPHARVAALLEAARASVASLRGDAADELVREVVEQVKDSHVRHKTLEKLLVTAYRQLPANHLDTIVGFGPVTAAILTAKIIDPGRFVEPGKLIGHFGIFPVQASSGIDRDGKSRLPVRMVMCRRGNDLVRRYLWMAALSAAQHNPACQPLYQRVRAKHPEQPSIAIGHVMRKLLHLALAIWKSGKPFDPEHYPWDKAAPGPGAMGERAQAAGHKNPEIEPERSVVTAACTGSSVTEPAAAGNSTGSAAPVSDMTMSPSLAHMPVSPPAAEAWIDFEHLKAQLPLERVLAQLGLLDGLRGRGPQRKGPCPLHAAETKPGHTFSVHLGKNVFQCFQPQCGKKGDILDLWATVKGLTLRAAAVDLVQTFNLEPAAAAEKRHG
jgi:transposase